jgi:L-ribulose-5-phosphate 4-epimerase
MTHETLKKDVYEANMALTRAGLVVLTWGNASGVDRDADDGQGGHGVVAIKPSGVAYDALTPEQIVLVSLTTGNPLPGEILRPSSDTPTHVCLYQRFPTLGGIAHTHSRYATSWAQAQRAIPCYGTTHADTFHGDVPLCRPLTADEIAEAYEWNTGVAIAEHFEHEGLDPAHVPGVLLPCHAPFAWGRTPAEAAQHAIIVEEVAALAWHTEMLNPKAAPAPEAITEKHFQRKHGTGAYYGQPS